ncbi:MAG: hypothetical protein PHO10_04375 [Gemmiger sp.]|nr:hypothetical protein [Gemmiger sp.]
MLLQPVESPQSTPRHKPQATLLGLGAGALAVLVAATALLHAAPGNHFCLVEETGSRSALVGFTLSGGYRDYGQTGHFTLADGVLTTATTLNFDARAGGTGGSDSSSGHSDLRLDWALPLDAYPAANAAAFCCGGGTVATGPFWARQIAESATYRSLTDTLVAMATLTFPDDTTVAFPLQVAELATPVGIQCSYEQLEDGTLLHTADYGPTSTAQTGDMNSPFYLSGYYFSPNAFKLNGNWYFRLEHYTSARGDAATTLCPPGIYRATETLTLAEQKALPPNAPLVDTTVLASATPYGRVEPVYPLPSDAAIYLVGHAAGSLWLLYEHNSRLVVDIVSYAGQRTDQLLLSTDGGSADSFTQLDATQAAFGYSDGAGNRYLAALRIANGKIVAKGIHSLSADLPVGTETTHGVSAVLGPQNDTLLSIRPVFRSYTVTDGRDGPHTLTFNEGFWLSVYPLHGGGTAGPATYTARLDCGQAQDWALHDSQLFLYHGLGRYIHENGYQAQRYLYMEGLGETSALFA